MPTEPAGAAGPLSQADVQQLESTLLPALERHHLRVLAHALRTLQQVQQSHQAGADQCLPGQDAIAQWLQKQPGLDDDTGFVQQLAQQLGRAGRQLEQLASLHGLPPLALELDQLMAWAQQQADQRLISPPPTTHQQQPAEPPERH